MNQFLAHHGGESADGALIPVDEAAARLGVRPPAVRARLRRGTLKGVYADGKWAVYESSLPSSHLTLEADMMAAEVGELEQALLRSERDAAQARCAMLADENARLRAQVTRLEAAIAALVATPAST